MLFETELACKLRESRMTAVLLTFIGLFFGIWFCYSAVTRLTANEQDAIYRMKTLIEGENTVVSVDAYPIEKFNEGKLIHVSGDATVDEIMEDTLFDITVVNVIKLQRIVKMYQWQEEQPRQPKEEQSEEGFTKPIYREIWSEQFIDSNKFKIPRGHRNPSMRIKEKTVVAKTVKLGDFNLPIPLIEKMNYSQKFTMTNYSFWQVQENLRSFLQNQELHFNEGSYYVGENPDHPQIGDLQISFEITQPTTVSIIAKQENSYLVPYQTQVGGKINLSEFTIMDAQKMFNQAKKSLFLNKLYKRLIWFCTLFLGFYALFGSWWMTKNSLLFLGYPYHFVGWLVALVLSIVFTIIIIALVQMNYNPILGKSLFIIAVCSLYFLKFARKPQRLILIPEQVVPIKT